MKTLRYCICAVGVLLSALNVNATPYASGVTVSSGTVNWHLNESVTNGNVYILFDNGTASNALGLVTAGPQSFSLGSHTNFTINIFNIGTGTPYQISPNPGTGAGQSALVDFEGPRGVGVNRNPNSPLFGTIYIANGSAGTDSVRASQRGIYALNADFTDAFGYGNTAMPTVGTGAGQIQYGSSGTYAPYRVYVGPDDKVYIGDASGCNNASSGSTTGGGVWMAQPNLSSAVDLFPFDGTASGNPFVVIGTPIAQGSYAAGTLTLYTAEWNRGPYQSVWQYQFFSNSTPITLPWPLANQPNPVAVSGDCPTLGSYFWEPTAPISQVNEGNISSFNGVAGDFYMGSDGKMYGIQERTAANTGQPALNIYDNITNGSCLLWDSYDQNGGSVDPLTITYSVAVSPDNRYVALGTSSGAPTGGNTANEGVIEYLSLTGQNPNGVGNLPDLSTLSRIIYNAAGKETVRGVAFDAADNVYGVSGSISDSMRAFSLGLTTLAVTSNDQTGTNGAFNLNFPGVTATVTASAPLISQANTYGNPLSGTYVISLGAIQSAPTTVFFTLSGTATNNATYTLSGATTTNLTSGSVVIPAGQTNATITITPSSSIVSADTLYATLTVSGSTTVSPIAPLSTTVAIANTGPQALAITGLQYGSMYRGISNDFAAFIVTRYGDTNVGSYVIPANAFTYAGTAVSNVDYLPAAAVTVNQGDQFEAVDVSDPVYTGVYKGNESILVTLNGNAPQPVSPGSSTANMTLIDDQDPPAPVLWSSSLTNAVDSTNWTLTFANTNLGLITVNPILIPDYPNYTAANPDPNSLDDFDVEFGYSIAADGVGQSPAMIAHGWTNALKMTVNKIAGEGASAGVNVFPQGRHFSGNYAVRFSMNLSEGTGSTTEYNSFGINCYGTNCDWFASDYSHGSGTTNSDGVWYGIDSDSDGNGVNAGFFGFTGQPLPNTGWTNVADVSALPFTNVFKNPVPYDNVDAGAPADGNGKPANTWSDVEIKQFKNVVTLSINKTPIIVYTNTSIYTAGDLMLGYDDPYASVGVSASPNSYPGAAVYYSNVRVVALTGPVVTSVTHNGTSLTINFTDPDTDDTASSFTLKSSSVVNGTYTAVSPAPTFTQSGATWSTTVTVPGSTTSEFYLVDHN